MKVKVTEFAKKQAEIIRKSIRMEYDYMSNQHSGEEDYYQGGDKMYHNLTSNSGCVCKFDDLPQAVKNNTDNRVVARKVSFDYKGNFGDIIEIHPDHVSNIVLKDIEKGLIEEVIE
jgi:hypothetical protein